MVDPTAFARVAIPERTGVGGGLASIIAGEQAGRIERQEQSMQQAKALGQSALESWKQGDKQGYQMKLRELGALNPQAADDLNKTFSGITSQNLGEAALNIYAATASPDMQAKKNLITNAKDILQAEPNSWMNQGLDNMLSLTDENQLDEQLLGTVNMLSSIGMLPGKKDGKQTPSQKTGAWLVKDDKGRVRPMIGVFDPDSGKFTTQYGQELPPDWQVVGKEGEAPGERRIAELEQKKGEARIQTQEKRLSSVIDRGITAAEAIPNLKRGIELLDMVQTGGVQAVSLRAKQLFGIETGDEGELSNRLSKSVLSQLRETFGAAFTENEGKRLERIEAGFSKSPETNKRLLNQALRMAQRKAQAARNAAMEAGDEYAVQEIDDLLSFTYSMQENQQQRPAAAQPETGQPAEQMKQFNMNQVQTIPVFQTVEEGEASGAPSFRVPTGNPAAPFDVYQQ